MIHRYEVGQVLEVISTMTIPIRVGGLEILLYQRELSKAKMAHVYDMVYAIMHNVYTMGGGKSSSGKSYTEYAEEIDKFAWCKDASVADCVRDAKSMFDHYVEKGDEET